MTLHETIAKIISEGFALDVRLEPDRYSESWAEIRLSVPHCEGDNRRFFVLRHVPVEELKDSELFVSHLEDCLFKCLQEYKGMNGRTASKRIRQPEESEHG